MGGRVVASRTFDTASQADADHFLPAIEFQKLIVSVGPTSLGVAEAGKLAGSIRTSSPSPRESATSSGCRPSGAAMKASMPSFFRPAIRRSIAKLAANNARVQALDQWVRMGGRLVLCVGKEGNEMLAEGSPLRQFAPGRFERMASLRQTGAIETYCGSRSSASESAARSRCACRG